MLLISSVRVRDFARQVVTKSAQASCDIAEGAWAMMIGDRGKLMFYVFLYHMEQIDLAAMIEVPTGTSRRDCAEMPRDGGCKSEIDSAAIIRSPKGYPDNAHVHVHAHVFALANA